MIVYAEPAFTLAEIAKHWSREQSMPPEQKTLEELICAAQRGEFKRANGLTALFTLEPFKHFKVGKGGRKAMLSRKALLKRDDNVVVDEVVYWEPSDMHRQIAMAPDDKEYFLHIWGTLRIEREDFGAWCDRRRSVRPGFWFGEIIKDESIVLPSKPGPNPGIRTSKEEICSRAKELLIANEIPIRHGALTLLTKRVHQYFPRYDVSTIRKYVQPVYREWRDKPAAASN